MRRGRTKLPEEILTQDEVRAMIAAATNERDKALVASLYESSCRIGELRLLAREACALYKKELDKLLLPEYSTVVYSPAHNDPPELAEYHLSETKEKKVRKAFRKPEEMPKILIVTEKLLTGFDAPILYCMYLDKPMRDHVLLQAIARVNRPYEDETGRKKPSGFVLDFVGIFDNFEKALAFDFVLRVAC